MLLKPDASNERDGIMKARGYGRPTSMGRADLGSLVTMHDGNETRLGMLVSSAADPGKQRQFVFLDGKKSAFEPLNVDGFLADPVLVHEEAYCAPSGATIGITFGDQSFRPGELVFTPSGIYIVVAKGSNTRLLDVTTGLFHSVQHGADTVRYISWSLLVPAHASGADPEPLAHVNVL